MCGGDETPMWQNLGTQYSKQGTHVATLALARDQDKGVASGRAYK
jgi:hypothetical protein